MDRKLKFIIDDRTELIFGSRKQAVIEGNEFFIIAYQHYAEANKTQIDIYSHHNILTPLDSCIIDKPCEQVTPEDIIDTARLSDKTQGLSFDKPIRKVKRPEEYINRLYELIDHANRFIESFLNVN